MVQEPLWQRCEIAWAAWLRGQGWGVDYIAQKLPNEPDIGARTMHIPGSNRPVPTPDIKAMKANETFFWEVKSRARPDIDTLTGESRHWITYRSYLNYFLLQQAVQTQVHIALYEYSTATSAARWLTVPLTDIAQHGFRGQIINIDGRTVDVIFWPVSIMNVQENGPHIDESLSQSSQIDEDPQSLEDIWKYEDTLRRKKLKKSYASVEAKHIDEHGESYAAIAQDPMLGLEVLSQKLGIPVVPRYSVLHIGNEQITDILGLLHYGIRVFLITNSDPFGSNKTTELMAFMQSRLLEWAVIPELKISERHWSVDGRSMHHTAPHTVATLPDWVHHALQAADQSGQINVAQYNIVHAPIDSDILVTAGAGTGKTETMSERLMFLLSTSNGGSQSETGKPYQMSFEEISLITFTRDAAREMRSRIARTIVLRQRLANRCVQPTIAWLLQLGRAQISTIHAFAKRLIQRNGSIIGLSPDFVVSEQTMPWRRMVIQSLSDPIQPLYRTRAETTPNMHEWVKHIEALWDALENNGVPLISFDKRQNVDITDRIDWGSTYLSNDEEIAKLTHATIASVTRMFTQHALREQTLSTGQLVSTAISVLEHTKPLPLKKPLRFLFVDEFQDTDALQMRLILHLREYFNTHLFVVGDAKQGIYRFRGAEGNAFHQLRERAKARKLPAFAEYSLNRNFRSDGRLLDSMHKYFNAWGKAKLLSYEPQDKLLPRSEVAQKGVEITFTHITKLDAYTQPAAQQVLEWRQKDRGASIAIICRSNYVAISVQQAIRANGGQCDILVGGSFFQSPAVREFRVLLEALVNPADDAALLELCETRWAGILFNTTVPPVDHCDDLECWKTPITNILDWKSRFASAAKSDTFDRSDLIPLRRRVQSLASLTRHMSGMSLIIVCRQFLKPDNCSIDQPDDETERKRYARCLTHLITTLDATFMNSSVTVLRILEWVRLQIATNHKEDEPAQADPDEAAAISPIGQTVALTVHKAKGLEYDYVLIPRTWAVINKQQTKGTVTSVQTINENKHRLIWRWLLDKHEYTNTTSQDAHLWDTEKKETIHEETRLLYVAMTRARHHLHIFRANPPAGDSWVKLLSMGESRNDN